MQSAIPLPSPRYSMAVGNVITLPNAPDGVTFLLVADNVVEASLLSLDTGYWVLHKHLKELVVQHANLLFAEAAKDPEWPQIWARKKETYKLFLTFRQRLLDESEEGRIPNQPELFATVKKESH